MKKFIITTTIEEEVEANDKDEAYQMFFESVGNEPQQTLATYLSDHLKIEEQEGGFNPAETRENLENAEALDEALNAVEVQDRIKNEVAITRESQNAGGNWTDDYKEGFIDGLQRSLELFSF